MFEKSMEEHAKNLQNRMDQLEADPLREHQTAIQTLQQKIRQLQEEISIKRSRYAEAAETVRKMDRRVKEMQFKVEEDRKNHQRIQGMVDQLRQSIRLVRIQSQEADEIAALNFAMFVKAQQRLEDVEERCNMAENEIASRRKIKTEFFFQKRFQIPHQIKRSLHL
ncbi:myosin heavy chain, muscle [Trichonephila clavata]|uniref:Myosin heavy chain, muscle n=1 Tax=Trichonephila clavata TaxID=2740835 RepID=A0A8X6I4J8_TRICU|nr:myosin heavy chain, muscle [Trichonephila clavata]